MCAHRLARSLHSTSSKCQLVFVCSFANDHNSAVQTVLPFLIAAFQRSHEESAAETDSCVKCPRRPISAASSQRKYSDSRSGVSSGYEKMRPKNYVARGAPFVVKEWLELNEEAVIEIRRD